MAGVVVPSSPKTYLPNQCWQCKEVVEKTIACAKCLKAQYCTTDCLVAHSSKHITECHSVTSITGSPDKDRAAAVLEQGAHVVEGMGKELDKVKSTGDLFAAFETAKKMEEELKKLLYATAEGYGAAAGLASTAPASTSSAAPFDPNALNTLLLAMQLQQDKNK